MLVLTTSASVIDIVSVVLTTIVDMTSDAVTVVLAVNLIVEVIVV